MQFTTTTQIARKWSKIFEIHNEAIVLSNNKPVWAILNYKIYERLKSSWYLDEVIQDNDLWPKDYLTWLEKNLEEWNNDTHDNLFT